MLKSSCLVVLLLITFVLCGRSSAQDISVPESDSNYPDRKALIVNNCPYVKLSDFSFSNQYSDGETRFDQDLKWQNIGKQALVAFEIVILKYDAFNQRLIGSEWTVTGTDSANWKPLDPGQSSSDGSRDLGEEQVYTAIAYVRIARLKDGTIWRANDAQLLPQFYKAAPDIEEFGDVKPDPKAKSK